MDSIKYTLSNSCFPVLEERAFVFTKTTLNLDKAGVQEILGRSLMSLYDGAKTRVRVHSELSEEFGVKIWMHQGSVQSPFLFAVVADVATKFARKCALDELLYADDLVQMGVTIKELRNTFFKWKEVFESKGFKVSLGKTKVMVSGDIATVRMSQSNVDPCGVCSLRVQAYSVLCLQCGEWINGRCAGVKSVTTKFLRNIICRKCEGNIGEAVGHKEKLCDEVETVGEFTYLGDRMSGGCKAAVTARK